MKKEIRAWMVPCATAAMTLIAAFSSYAATGWQQENGSWYYYQKDGSHVENEWRRSGNYWFYLGEDGEMMTDSLVEHNDDYYYVNSDGAMVGNEWRELPNEDAGGEDEEDTCWYYFQSNGKAYKASESGKTTFKKITKADGQVKRYAFDSEGRLLYGWLNDSSERQTGEDAWKNGIYYCGEAGDGALAVNEWRKLDVQDDENTDDDFDDTHWFFFGTNGKKIQGTTKTINGRKYRFDENGASEFKWYTKASTSVASESNMYYNQPTQCWLATGWFQVVPDESVDVEAYQDDEEYWFYAKSNGDLIKSEIKSINGYKYAFNEKGEMLHGLYKLTFNGSEIASYEEIETEDDMPDEDEDCLVYYFGDSPKEGVMETGKCTIELDGEKYTYNFRKSGKNKGSGYDEIYEDAIYIKGRMLKADRDSKYEMVEYKGENYLINTSGKIMKNKKNIRDADEMYYSTDKRGVVTYHDSEKQ